jgi:uncharacterized repeat protein (TIGR01451 family)
MTRLRLIRLVQLGVFLATTACALSVRSQSSDGSSLADRIRDLRRGSSADSAGAMDDPNATTPVQSDQPSPRPRAATSAGQTGLPQINAKSLIPSNLFGRPSASPSESKEPQPMPKRGPMAAAKKALPTTASPSNSPEPSHRYVASDPSSTSLGQTMKPITVAEKPAAAQPPVAVPSPLSVRSSPEQRTPLNFDPEALRNDLAGAFPAPADKQQSASSNKASAATSPKHNDPVSATAPTAPVAENQPVPQPANRGHYELSPSPSSSHDATVESHQPFPTVGDLLGHRASPSSKTAGPSEAPAAANDADTRESGTKAFQTSAKPRSSPSVRPGPVTMTPVKSSETAAGHFNGTAKQPLGDVSPDAASGVLVTNRTPVIATEMEGPKQITIGREASYHLSLRNDGAAAAEDFVATIRIPEGVEVVNTSATRGIVRQPQGGESKTCGALEWQVQRLDPQAAETLTLRLIPHESRPLELGVTWTHAPVGAHAVVEVQEPLLKMQIAGPDEVLFGKSQVYRLMLNNPGTGIAENVKVELQPLGGNPGSTTSHRVGDLAPGASKSIEVELTAREAGKLSVKAVASAEGGLTTDASKDLFCRKPELEVDWRGPSTQYAGTAANYFFRVRNPGTATAEDVAVHVSLPEGAEFVSASDGQTYDSEHGEVLWRVGSLRPGDDCYMELKCTVHTPGENQLKVAAATAAGDLTDNKVATTNVVALADLKLDVSDPPGPIPVGQEATYEIHVVNRGNNAAQDVGVVALFSDGLEPEAVEGGQYTVADGRVSFRAVDKIAAGQTISLRVHARAMKPGTHVFRAEVLCKDLEIKLAAEETTRFYQDEIVRDDPQSSQPKLGTGHTETVR